MQYIAFFPWMAQILDSADRALILQKLDDILIYEASKPLPDEKYFYVDADGNAWYRTTYEYLVKHHFFWMSHSSLKRHIKYLREESKVVKVVSTWSDFQFKKVIWIAIDRVAYADLMSTAKMLHDQNVKMTLSSGQNDTIVRSKWTHRPVKMTPSSGQNDTQNHESDHESDSPIQDQSSSSSGNDHDSTTLEGCYDENSEKPFPLHEIDPDRVVAYEQNIATLTAYGVTGKKLIDLSAKALPQDVNAWIAYVESLPDWKIKTSRHSYLVAMLESGQPAPEPLDPGIRAKSAPRTGDFYVSGKYSDEVES